MSKPDTKLTNYESIDLDSLVTYAVWLIEQKNETCTFERIVEECFTLFPDKFSLFGYPHWPDSARVNKSWLRCRTDKGLIKGKVKTGFELTEKGLRLVEDLLKHSGIDEKRMRQVESSSKRIHQGRTHADTVIRWIEASELYKSFEDDPRLTSICESDVLDFFQCVRGTTKIVLRERLNLYKDAAKLFDKELVLDLIARCEQLYPTLFSSKLGR